MNRFLGITLLLVIVSVFGLGGYYVYFYYRYPVMYKGYILENAQCYFLDEHLVASIINVESSFDKDAVSKAGAIGLMQIMPATGEEIARKLAINNFSKEMLFHEYTNIKFGCFYLRYLLDIFNGDLRNALASYNAGISNVYTWLSNPQYSSDGISIKTTPYGETNEYIERVLRNMDVYKSKFK